MRRLAAWQNCYNRNLIIKKQCDDRKASDVSPTVVLLTFAITSSEIYFYGKDCHFKTAGK